MQLVNCELLPGVIKYTNDDKKLGRIKCVIPGYVDSSFSEENMPWVRPLGMFNHQSFSKMMPGYKVWILVNKANYNEYWYFPFFELNNVAKEYLDPVYDDDQPEVLIAHNLGGNHATLTYDENNGFSEKIGQHHIDLHPDGHISLLGGSGEVDIDGSKVKAGQQGGNYQPAVLGDELLTIFKELQQSFSMLQTAAVGMLAPLNPGFTKAATATSKANKFIAQNVQIN